MLLRSLARSGLICEEFENSSTSYNDELDRLTTELSTDPMPCFEDWIKVTTSEMAQLKSQLMFLNYVVDRCTINSS